jgi:uncharacterized integral membrane protein
MSFKFISIILLSVAITVIFMQNTEEVTFNLFWAQIAISKLLIMLIATLFGFIIGLIIARLGGKKNSEQKNIPLEITQTEDTDEEYIGATEKQGKLSQEDQDYLQ